MAVRVQPRQLALPLPHGESLSRDDFLEGDTNREGLRLVEAWPDWPGRIAALVGPEGSGKSHLAAIWAMNAGARSIPSHALAPDRVPDCLATGAVVVEDVSSLRLDERGLFHLLNLARQDDAFVLLTSRQPLAALSIALPDLASRLRAAPAVTLRAPDDGLFRSLIVKFCADRQMSVDEPLVAFLASRIDRSIGAARHAVEHLDSEALRLGRPVTRALAADLFRNA